MFAEKEGTTVSIEDWEELLIRKNAKIYSIL